MGLINRALQIFNKRQTEPAPNETSYALMMPRRSDAGVPVNEISTTSVGTAWACGSLIARSIAQLPAQVMAPRSNDPEDGAQRLADHPVERLLHREPNPEMSAMTFRERLLLCGLFHGNGFAEIERSVSGQPLALWPIHPDRVEARRDAITGEMFYSVDRDTVLPVANMFHLPGPAMDGPMGMSTIAAARQTLGLAIAQERFAASFISNQAAPSGLIKVKGNISDAAMKRQRAEIDALHRGSGKAGRIAIVDDASTWEQIGLTMLDSEFLAQRRFAVEEICRWFGVPPQMVGDTSKQTFANFEQAGLNFLALAVVPWVVRFEQEANRKLFSRAVAGRQQPYVKLNTTAIVRSDLAARYRAYALGRQWGFLSANDVRRLEDLPPIGPEGDAYLTPLNMEPAGNDDGGGDGAGDQGEVVRRLSQYRRA